MSSVLLQKENFSAAEDFGQPNAFATPLSRPVICIVGPTASGKTDVAQEVALRIGGEVVSADSMQIYKGMDIGTGKIPVADRKVPHHGFDLVNPGDPYSAALFQSFARKAFAEIDSRGNFSILAGGTGLYVRAAIDAYDFPKGEQVENPVRAKYNAYAEEHGALALWELLKEVDPQSAAVLHYNNVRRVIRAFELIDEGTTYAKQLSNLAELPQLVPAIFFGLQVEPDILRARIDLRVERMIEAGLIGEVKSLLEQGFREGVTAPQAIGYKEIVLALEGTVTLADAVEQIKNATRRYAKRQRTWFRKDTRINWVDATSGDTSLAADIICESLLSSGMLEM